MEICKRERARERRCAIERLFNSSRPRNTDPKSSLVKECSQDLEEKRGNRLGRFQSFVCGLNHKPLETHPSSAAFSLHPSLCLHGHFLFPLFLFLFNALQVGLITNRHYWGQLTILEVNIGAIMCVYMFLCVVSVYVGHLGIYFAFNPTETKNMMA